MPVASAAARPHHPARCCSGVAGLAGLARPHLLSTQLLPGGVEAVEPHHRLSRAEPRAAPPRRHQRRHEGGALIATAGCLVSAAGRGRAWRRRRQQQLRRVRWQVCALRRRVVVRMLAKAAHHLRPQHRRRRVALSNDSLAGTQLALHVERQQVVLQQPLLLHGLQQRATQGAHISIGERGRQRRRSAQAGCRLCWPLCSCRCARCTCCCWNASLARMWARMRAASSARLKGLVT